MSETRYEKINEHTLKVTTHTFAQAQVKTYIKPQLLAKRRQWQNAVNKIAGPIQRRLDEIDHLLSQFDSTGTK